MNKELIVKLNPKTYASEAIKMIRTNLEYINKTETTKAILITSSLPGEGKSFISSNLATSLAQLNKKVIIIDCDLRKGRLHKIFTFNNKKGMSELLKENELDLIDDYITSTNIDNLDIITRGSIPFNPAELLTYKSLDIVIELLKERYDYIIIDGTPILGLSDSISLAKKVDMTALVSAIGVSTNYSLLNAKKALESVKANVIGVIANKVPRTKERFYKYE